MQFDAATIERMVREVLNQIQRTSPTDSRSAALPQLPQSPPSPTQPSLPQLKIPRVTTPTLGNDSRDQRVTFPSPVNSIPTIPQSSSEAETRSIRPSVSPANSAATNSATATSLTSSNANAQTASSLGPSASVTIQDRVVTADILKRHVATGVRVLIGEKSLLTPSAQDFLRSNRVAWERAPDVVAATGATSVVWQILLSSANESVKKVVDALCSKQRTVRRELAGTAAETAQAAVSAMSRGEVPGLIILTAEPYLVACRVNRVRSIRAAVVQDLKSWASAAASLKPNVVCIDPADRSYMELQNLMNRITNGPAPAAPTGWSD